ncbi:hypothetical protein PIB30_097088 [Stylosanthes scabra]|uniref:RNase H type-1 domain-containing protein n=1 Tax=Stylosanthes scabra TaxID=79078 RepID=A0ABU6SWI4_9FABA|nr:hypothetical protein [Stylosanthes scabra]
MSPSELCPRCNLYSKTILHFLRDCPLVRLIWDHMKLSSLDVVQAMDAKRWFWCGGELFAIWRGLSLAWECGFRDVSCETDSLDAFLAAQLHFNPEHAADTDLIMKIHEIIQWNWNAEVVLIQRTANIVANYLAKRAIDMNVGYMELLEPLSNMHTLLCDVPSTSVMKS